MRTRDLLLALGLVVAGAAALVVVLGRGGGGEPARAPRPRAAAPRPYPPPPALAAPTLFLSPTGSDRAPCTSAEPCRGFDRAYHLAKPGVVVQLAAGRYGDQAFTADPAKDGRGCESARDAAACVVLQPAEGAAVRVRNLDFGINYSQAGPAGIAIATSRGSSFRAASTAFTQAHEIALWGVEQGNLFVTGGSDLALRGGAVGGVTSKDGTHPEIQRVYGSQPLIVPERLTFEGVRFHDINTTSPTAHVDCLQVENGTDIVLRGNTFERCGSTAVRLSYGTDAPVKPPTHVVVENNAFGACADTPVSQCFYAAQLGVGHDVLIRNNTSTQALQPTGDPQLARDVRYVGNVAPGVRCESFVAYRHNVWTQAPCGPTDRRAATLDERAAARAGDPADHPPIDIAGRPRPRTAPPDAGATQVSR